MSRLDRLWQWFQDNSTVPYYAGGGDNDHDGTPDRADVDDGNGVDCSGAVWASYAFAWAPDPPPFPLSSTSGYAAMASRLGLFVPVNDRRQGDILLHSSNGDVFHSDGPVGHTELDTGVTQNGRWRCAGSSGSGRGVGYVDRPPSFWQARIRVPGLDSTTPPSAPTGPIITATQLRALVTALAQPSEDDDMATAAARINWPISEQLNTFSINANDGQLRQTFVNTDGKMHVFNVSKDIAGFGLLAQEKPLLGIAPDGKLLVGVYGRDGTYNELSFKAGDPHWGVLTVAG